MTKPGARMALRVAAAAAVAGLVIGLGVACVETQGSACAWDAQVAPDADAEPARVDARVEPDAAVPDASVPPEGVPYDFCDQPFFELPIGGFDEAVMGHSLWEDRLVYNRGPTGVAQWDLYYLNLTDCMEYRLTRGFRGIDSYILGSEIIWSENKEYDYRSPEYHCQDLYSYDLRTWTMKQLTDLPVCEWAPKTNGRYVVYAREPRPNSQGMAEELLWDRWDGTERQLAVPEAMGGYVDINERYVAWSAYTEYADSLGKDVFYLDLVTGEQTHVPNSANYFCYGVRLWDEYLTYACSEYWHESWYHLFLHHIPTGEELELDGAGKDTRLEAGVIHRHLVMWNTTRYMDEVPPFEENNDIVIYDMYTGVRRRLTSSDSTLAVWLLYFPYVFFIRPVAYHTYKYYMANLVSLGVTDATGFVIPGDPVIDPPE